MESLSSEQTASTNYPLITVKMVIIQQERNLDFYQKKKLFGRKYVK